VNIIFKKAAHRDKSEIIRDFSRVFKCVRDTQVDVQILPDGQLARTFRYCLKERKCKVDLSGFCRELKMESKLYKIIQTKLKNSGTTLSDNFLKYIHTPKATSRVVECQSDGEEIVQDSEEEDLQEEDDFEESGEEDSES